MPDLIRDNEELAIGQRVDEAQGVRFGRPVIVAGDLNVAGPGRRPHLPVFGDGRLAPGSG